MRSTRRISGALARPASRCYAHPSIACAGDSCTERIRPSRKGPTCQPTLLRRIRSTSSMDHPDLRIVTGLLGAATVILGIVLLFNPTSAAHLLAVLIGIGFIVGGILEIAVGWSLGSRFGATVLGGDAGARRPRRRLLAEGDAVDGRPDRRSVADRARRRPHRHRGDRARPHTGLGMAGHRGCRQRPRRRARDRLAARHRAGAGRHPRDRDHAVRGAAARGRLRAESRRYRVTGPAGADGRGRGARCGERRPDGAAAAGGTGPADQVGTRPAYRTAGGASASGSRRSTAASTAR